MRALHADRTLTSSSHQNRHAEVRQRLFAYNDGPQLEAPPVRVAVDDERLARLDNPARQALAVLERRELVSILVRELDDIGLPVEQGHVGDVGLEQRADLVAHQLEQSVEIELARELLRDRVDRGELGRALLRLGEEPRVLDGHCRLQRKTDEELELAVGEGVASGAPHRHHAFDGLPGEQRRDHESLVLFLVGAGDQDGPRIATGIVDEFGTAALDEVANDAFADVDHCGLDGLRDIAERDDRTVSLSAGIGDEDGAAPSVEQIFGVTSDPIHYRGQIQCRRNLAPDFRESGGLARAALRLVEKPRVLQRDAHRIGERLQQAHIRVAERVLAVHVQQLDESARLVPNHQRYVHRRFLHWVARHQIVTAVLFYLLRHVLVDHQRLAGAQHVGAEALVVEWRRPNGDPSSAYVRIGVVDHIGLRIVDAHVDVRLMEDFADLVADDVVDPLHVELGSKRLLHAVDDGELGGPLLALLEQALRLVEEPRVLERHAHARGDCAEQAHLRLAVDVLALVVFHRDHSERPITREDRDEDG